MQSKEIYPYMKVLGKNENIAAVISSGSIVILQFGSESCAPCYAIKDRIDRWNEEHPKVSARYISLEERPEAAAEYSIFSVPAVLVFADGKLTVRESGVFSLDEILKRTERYMELMNGQELGKEAWL